LLPAENYKLPPEAEGLDGTALHGDGFPDKRQHMPAASIAIAKPPRDIDYTPESRTNTRRHIKSSPSTGSAVTTVPEAEEDEDPSHLSNKLGQLHISHPPPPLPSQAPAAANEEAHETTSTIPVMVEHRTPVAELPVRPASVVPPVGKIAIQRRAEPTLESAGPATAAATAPTRAAVPKQAAGTPLPLLPLVDDSFIPNQHAAADAGAPAADAQSAQEEQTTAVPDEPTLPPEKPVPEKEEQQESVVFVEKLPPPPPQQQEQQEEVALPQGEAKAEGVSGAPPAPPPAVTVTGEGESLLAGAPAPVQTDGDDDDDNEEEEEEEKEESAELVAEAAPNAVLVDKRREKSGEGGEKEAEDMRDTVENEKKKAEVNAESEKEKEQKNADGDEGPKPVSQPQPQPETGEGEKAA